MEENRNIKAWANKLIIINILWIIFLGCQRNEKVIISNEMSPHIEKHFSLLEKSVFIPDTTINSILELRNPLSLKLFYLDYKNIIYTESIRTGSPIIIFINKNKTQYLLGYKFEGDVRNSLSCFEIGYLKNENFKYIKQHKTDCEKFITESGIQLGISFSELISLKGKNYTVEKNKTDTLIVYKADKNTSEYVNRHSMASYFMEYFIKADKIEKIYFGFDYP